MTRPHPTNNSRGLVIVGAGGFGREALEVVNAINRDSPSEDPKWVFTGFLDDAKPALPRDLDDGEIWLGRIKEASTQLPSETSFVVAIGDPLVRRDIVQLLESHGHVAGTLVHPRASIGARVNIGAGSIIGAHATLTTDIRVGKHVIVNINTTIGHDCVIDDFVTISPLCAISGAARVGALAYLGSSAVLLPGVQVGGGAVVGAGAVVTRDVLPATTVVGVPARARQRDTF